LAAVLDYLCGEVLEVAAQTARENKKKRVTPRYINLAIRNDHELNELLKDVTIPDGGVLQFINPVLLPMKTAKKRPAAVDVDEA